MTYSQALDYISSKLRFGSRPGLERMTVLLERLGRPQDRLKFVHVAGTNGKGSVCTMTACIAKAAGYKTGLYISPYVSDFCERMQINNQMISHSALARLVEQVKPAVDAMEAEGMIITEFELNTALALVWFAQENCDLVVLEVGLGGLYDATNVIENPLVTALVSISFDHMSVLGRTLSEIALNKTGIFKQGCPAVIYPLQAPEVMEVIRREAAKKNVALVIPDPRLCAYSVSGLTGYQVKYEGMSYSLSLMGEHQVYNSLVAVEIARLLRAQGYPITDEDIRTGIHAAAIPARFEILSREPFIIVDGGHNPSCGEVIAKAVDTYLAGKKIIGIAGMIADKDVENTLKSVLPYLSHVITLAPESPHPIPPDQLADQIAAFGNTVEVGRSYYSAVKKAVSLAGSEGAVLIFGSFYLAGRMRKEVNRFLKSLK